MRHKRIFLCLALGAGLAAQAAAQDISIVYLQQQVEAPPTLSGRSWRPAS